MNIEIHQPELEAMILARMQTGRFETIEDVIADAMRSTRLETEAPATFQGTIDDMFAEIRGLADDLDWSRTPGPSRVLDFSHELGFPARHECLFRGNAQVPRSGYPCLGAGSTL